MRDINSTPVWHMAYSIMKTNACLKTFLLLHPWKEWPWEVSRACTRSARQFSFSFFLIYFHNEDFSKESRLAEISPRASECKWQTRPCYASMTRNSWFGWLGKTLPPHTHTLFLENGSDIPIMDLRSSISQPFSPFPKGSQNRDSSVQSCRLQIDG